MMNFKKIFAVLIIFLFIIISIESKSEDAKKPITINILSKDKLGEIEGTIILNHDSGFFQKYPSVTGDIKKYFETDKVIWIIDNDGLKILPKNFEENINVRGAVQFNAIIFKETYYMNRDISSYAQKYISFFPPVRFLIISYIMYDSAHSSHTVKESFYPIINSDNYDSFKTLIQTAQADADKDKLAWEKINKNSIKDLIEFNRNTKSTTFKEESEKELNLLLDKKISSYLNKNSKSISKYYDYQIYFEDGTESCKLFELLRLPILSINPTSGEKINLKTENNSSYENGFNIILGSNNDMITLTFKPYKGKLTIMGLQKSNSKKNPKKWEYAFAMMVQTFSVYPKMDFIDIDLLEGL